MKGYVQEQSINARVDESSIASAINEMSFDNTIRTYGDNAANLVAIFSVTSPLIITVCTWIIFSLLIGTQCYSHTRQQDKTTTMDNMDNSTLLMRLQHCITNVRHSPSSHYTKDKKAAIISSVVIGFVRLLLIVALDCSATFYTLNLLEKIHHDRDSAHRILYSTPFFLLAYDATCLIVYAISVVTVYAKIINFDGETFYYYLTLTLSVPIASILLHLPYIATAYLNDANYAGSVLILYTVVTFLEFIVLQFIFIQWFNLKLAEQHNSKPEDSSQKNQKSADKQNTESNSRSPAHEASSAKEAKSVKQGSQCHSKTCLSRCHLVSFTVIVFFSLFFLYWIIGISVCFFYYLPINHSISSTSNQIIIVYQTGLIFVGAIVAYKTFFKRRNLFVKALDDCEKEIVKDLLLTKDEN